MKERVLFVLILVSSCAVVTASTMTVTTFDAGNGRLMIGYSVESGARPAAFGITLSLSDGATLDEGGIVSVLYPFSFFPDYAYENPQNYCLGDGTPIVGNLPATHFSISMAAFEPGASFPDPPPGDLNGDMRVDMYDLMVLSSKWLWQSAGHPLTGDLNADGFVDMVDAAILASGIPATPMQTDALIVLDLIDGGKGYTDVTIDWDPLRGGIVDMNGMPYDVVLPQTVHMVIPEPGTVILLAAGGLLAVRSRRARRSA